MDTRSCLAAGLVFRRILRKDSRQPARTPFPPYGRAVVPRNCFRWVTQNCCLPILRAGARSVGAAPRSAVARICEIPPTAGCVHRVFSWSGRSRASRRQKIVFARRRRVGGVTTVRPRGEARERSENRPWIARERPDEPHGDRFTESRSPPVRVTSAGIRAWRRFPQKRPSVGGRTVSVRGCERNGRTFSRHRVLETAISRYRNYIQSFSVRVYSPPFRESPSRTRRGCLKQWLGVSYRSAFLLDGDARRVCPFPRRPR